MLHCVNMLENNKDIPIIQIDELSTNGQTVSTYTSVIKNKFGNSDLNICQSLYFIVSSEV